MDLRSISSEVSKKSNRLGRTSQRAEQKSEKGPWGTMNWKLTPKGKSQDLIKEHFLFLELRNLIIFFQHGFRITVHQ